jgi:hypothetical protein
MDGSGRVTRSDRVGEGIIYEVFLRESFVLDQGSTNNLVGRQSRRRVGVHFETVPWVEGKGEG